MSERRPEGAVRRKSLFMKQLPLQIFALSGIAYLVVFNILPMFGLVMGFKNYTISSGIKGIFTSQWVGLKYFKEFFHDYQFPTLLKNTIGISLLKLVFTFPLPIIFAIMLSQMPTGRFKKLTQTASYLPHFISWVILTGIFMEVLSPSRGPVNALIRLLGGELEIEWCRGANQVYMTGPATTVFTGEINL